MDRVKEYAISLKLSVESNCRVGEVDLFNNEHAGVREALYYDDII